MGVACGEGTEQCGAALLVRVGHSWCELRARAVGCELWGCKAAEGKRSRGFAAMGLTAWGSGFRAGGKVPTEG